MKKHGVVWVIAVICLVSLVAVACAPAPGEVVKPRAVKIGLSLGLTGPIASTVAPISHGILAYADYASEQGGVEYRETATGELERVALDIVWEDNGYSAPKALTIYKRQKAWGMNLHVLVMSPDLLAAIVSREQLPLMSVGNLNEVSIKPQPIYVTTLYGSYLDQLLTFVKWVSGEWKEARPPRIGVIFFDAPTHRASAGGGAVSEELVREFGGELAGVEWLAGGVTDATIELTRLKNAGADWILIWHVTGAAMVILKDAERLGIRDTVKWAVGTYGFSEDLVKLLGERAEGIHGGLNWSLPSEDLPGVRLGHEVMNGYYGREANATNLQGVATTMIVVEAIRLALEKAGYENLTPEAVNDALHSLTDFETGGLMAPITIEPSYPAATELMKMAVIKEGRLVPTSDWVEVSRVMLRFAK